MKKLLLLAAAASLMAACAESAAGPTAPAKKVPAARANDLDCGSGYIIAYDEYGNPYCAPDGGGQFAALSPSQPTQPSHPSRP